MAQAEARAGGAHGNKGWDAAMAALEMSDLFDRIDLAADEG
jgi:6,7-dimethyl-8-ribityllumazine synthase